MRRCNRCWRRITSTRWSPGRSRHCPSYCGWVEPHWDSFDRLLVIKGPAWVEERTEAREAGLAKAFRAAQACQLPLAGNPHESVVLSIRPRES